MVAGPAGIPASKQGAVSGDWPLWAAFSGTTPVVGDAVGTVASAYTLATGKTGFRVLAVDSVGGFILVQPAVSSGGWEIGNYKLHAGVVDRIDTPAGYWFLFCDGGAFSATDYPALHTLFPTNYLPDFQVRFLLGAAASGDYDLDFEDDLGVIGNRIPVLPGVHHTHAGGTVTGHTGVSGDATDQVTGYAVSDGMGPYLNLDYNTADIGHHHVIPADALQHHSHPWVCDSSGNTGYESPTAPDGKWPPCKALGVFILAKIG
jgi:hypothetical protein